MVLSVEPPMYGREPAGQSSTPATHQPAAATTAASPATSPSSRRRSGVGAHTSQTRPNAGTTRNAWSGRSGAYGGGVAAAAARAYRRAGGTRDAGGRSWTDEGWRRR